MEIATFWNKQHSLAEKAQTLYDQLVPGQGNCTTLQGEMIRASSKIGYDWYNNGWGCNNWSGAVCFIKENYHLFPNPPEKCFIDQLMKELDYVSEFSHGEPCDMNYGGRNCLAVTKIHEIIVNTILANPEPIANTDDMLKYTEADYQECCDEDEDEEEYDEDGGW